MWGFLPESALVDGHPGTKGFEVTPSEDFFQCSHKSYGLCLDGLSCVDSPRLDKQMQRDVGGTGQAGMGWENASEKSRLNIHLFLITVGVQRIVWAD